MSDEARKVITPEALISYPHLFVPRPGPSGGEPKFSCALVFLEGTDLTALQTAILAAAQEKWGDKAAGMFKAGKLRNPLRTDWEDKGYPENSVFLNCSSKTQPGMVEAFADPTTGLPQVIEDANALYPGAVVRASIRAFAYDAGGNKGVSFGLNNLQKLRDGDRLDSRVAATSEFDVVGERPVADMPDADASELKDILGVG